MLLLASYACFMNHSKLFGYSPEFISWNNLRFHFEISFFEVNQLQHLHHMHVHTYTHIHTHTYSEGAWLSVKSAALRIARSWVRLQDCVLICALKQTIRFQVAQQSFRYLTCGARCTCAANVDLKERVSWCVHKYLITINKSSVRLFSKI